MTSMIFFLLTGFVLLLIGGNVFVDSSVWLAEKTGIPKVIIGATVVSLATTAPEMIVSFIAAANGSIDIAIGNAVGSTTVNTGFILAVSVVFLPLAIKRGEILIKSLILITSVLILLLFGLGGSIDMNASILLLICFIIFMTSNVFSAAKSSVYNQAVQAQEITSGKTGEIPLNILKFIGGAASIVIGSRLLVDNGSQLAAVLGVSQRVIGITVIAAGTSLPEFITAVTAVIKKQSDLSVGNIIGANIVNISLVQPVCVLLAGKSLPVTANMAYFDIPACLLICCIAVLPLMVKEKFYKAQGLALMAAYLVYVVITVNI